MKRIRKRLSALLLAMILCLSLLPGTAGATQEKINISNITLNITSPTAGETPERASSPAAWRIPQSSVPDRILQVGSWYRFPLPLQASRHDGLLPDFAFRRELRGLLELRQKKWRERRDSNPQHPP